MDSLDSKQRPGSPGFSTVFLFFAIILIGMPIWVSFLSQETEADFGAGEIALGEAIAVIQGNSLLSLPNQQEQPFELERGKGKRFPVLVTAYSSSPLETDDEPYITAAGTQVRQGVVANNLLPLGTRVRLPELYGERVFVVEDRMNRRKGIYQIDIWFPSYWEAKNFGAKKTYVEVLD
jgi:3D (Asp-Asp-Asp) domain-containing protein